MKRCPKCGKEYSDENGFCSSCGVPLNGVNETGFVDGVVEVKSAKSKKIVIFVAVVIILVVAVIAYFFCFNSNSDTSSSSSGKNTLFHNGLVAVQLGDKWGYIDKTGSYVIDPQFDYVDNFASNGLAVVGVGDYNNRKYGYVNKTGSYVINPQFNSASSFANNGLAAVMSGEKFGYIDKTGKYIINPQFYDALDFSNDGLAIVAESELKYGYIDKTGKYVINPQFAFVDKFDNNGLARVVASIGDDLDCIFGYINRTGKYVINPQFNYVANFSDNGLARVRNGDKWGYIDKTGSYIINPQYDMAGDFAKNGLAMVGTLSFISEDIYFSHWGFIDKDGSEIINLEYGYNRINDFSDNGLAAVSCTGNNGWRYIDKNGNIAWFRRGEKKDNDGYNAVFEDARDFAANGLACVKSAIYMGEDENGEKYDYKWGYICKEGEYFYNYNGLGLGEFVKYAIEPQFDYATDFYDDGYAVVSIENKFGIINSYGDYIVNPQFDDISFFNWDSVNYFDDFEYDW